MTRPILVDCDGVISNLSRSVLRLAHERSIALDKGEDDITTWEYTTCLGWDYVNAAITNAIRDRDFVYRMHPYPGAFAALRRLEAKFGADNVLVCTSPWNAEWAAQRYAWLADFAGVPSKRVIMCSAKHWVPGFLIDDHVNNFDGRHWTDSFLVARPANEENPAKLRRGTLNEAVELLVSQ